ncbi:MAG: Stk1 family PASTA domain-containing Ser/Thr kinase [Bacillota bacterium]|nr:Stk1 family PASTA domain-containing Ser/Thr kinase [Bacillota bacterium]MDW7682581.1 Stk1 family PASTA domain-containing Ser/Thr kinase [Bacillota bacterium]
MIGKILGNRYQVVEKIGDGGTAFVFKGMDSLLNRHVTVKVLRPEYVSDQDFVRRFRREAQAAASLSHPNIVSIYDVGYEDGIHYIVMEYIQGQSLKEIIEDLGHLPARMAVDYACQIAHALGNAHKHGIIHRDIKPHNVLITEDGRVKVTDFGIAQAVTASTVTYNGAILGSVHYFSPEQARGAQTEEKSDIYSLGIVLFEMLTGKVPYSGDSPVSVALMHLQEPIPKPRDMNPDIPPAVERIILRAVEKDPQNRYGSAREIAEELSDWLMGRETKNRNTAVGGTDAGDDRSPESTKRAKKKISPRKRWAIIAGVLLFIALLVTASVALRNYFVVPEVDVPAVEGESLSRAADMLDEAGLEYRIVEQTASNSVASGHVIRQTPSAGRRVKVNREIELVLSTGPDLVQVEDVVGKMKREAELILDSQGFVVELVERHDEAPSGTVIQQDPGRGHRISRGSTVTIVVSLGGRPVPMRDLRGIPVEDAKNWLELYGLELRGIKEEHSDRYVAGLVMEQFPEPDEEVRPGDYVDLTVSQGPDPSTLPQHEIRISTDEIPEGETVTVVVRDAYGERTETFENDGEPIVTYGWGSGEVEVRWQDQVKTRTFPEE